MKLDDLIFSGIDSVSSADPKEQAASAAAPVAYSGNTAKTMVIALAVFWAAFYALHLLERWAKI